MALTIVPRADRGPSRGEKIGDALRGTMEILAKHQAEAKNKALLEKENQSLKAQGIDLYGITDPKIRQQYVAESLKGRSAKDLEALKKKGRQEFVEGLYGRSESQGSQLASGQPSQEMAQPAGLSSGGAEQNVQDQTMPQQNEQIQGQEGQRPQKPQKRLFEDKDIARAMIEDPNIGRAMQTQNDINIRERREEIKAEEKAEADQRKDRNKKEMAFFKYNEPKLSEIAGTQRKINVDNARFNRLDNLFSDESKFPSPLLAALVTRDGQINDVAYSQLTPEAQEAVKLIIDSTSGIKDTYGARVTNFDLQTYLRKLPSLLTSPEGRRRVIRDLKGINDINEVYNEGIQDVFDKAGGSDKISFSEAERRFKKEYGSELDRKINKFVTPEDKIFADKPNPRQYLGKKVKDKETGEIFISDGNEWKLFQGE